MEGNMRSKFRSKIFVFTFAMAGVLLATTSLANTYRLYINKDQGAQNYVEFTDALSATVTHTSEGMELILPGVEVQLRCKPGSCVMAWSEGAGTEQPECNSAFGGGCEEPEPEQPVSPPTTDSCSNIGRVVCSGFVYGPGGTRSGTGSDPLQIPVGKVLVSDYKTIPGNYYGDFAWVPNSAAQPENVLVKVWLSTAPDGDPIETFGCYKTTSVEAAMYIDQTNTLDFGCQIPNVEATYFFNMVVCNTVSTDRTCSAPGVTYGDRAAQIFLAHNLNQ